MPVKMQCPSCGVRFSAMDELIGQVVPCPQCDTLLEVSDPKGPIAAATPARVDDDDDFRLAPAEVRSPLSHPSLEELAAPTTAPNASGTAEHLSQNEADSDPSRPGGKLRHCPQCGEPLGSDGMLCTGCGYHTVLKRKILGDVSDLEENTEAGFDRWLGEQLEVGESAESVMLWTDALVAVVLAIVFMTQGLWSLSIVAPVAGLYVFWRISNRLRRQREGQIIGLRGPLWRLILMILRVVSWRSLSNWRQAPRKLDLRLRTDADQALGKTDLSTVEVVDCAGSSLTNAGLLCLDNAASLRFLVLNKCRVSREAVARLQTRRRDCWIWL